ncbi:MAG: hypothetical protein ACREAC_30345, partial [Blastocatellia bacterium]
SEIPSALALTVNFRRSIDHREHLLVSLNRSVYFPARRLPDRDFRCRNFRDNLLFLQLKVPWF